MTKPDITDTTQISSEERVAYGLPGGIRMQEAQGQRELLHAEQLPIHGLLGADRDAFEAMGIKILDTPSKDSLFCHVELPNGWKKVATDHVMWTDLVDDQGVRRAKIFYKAAFYDRSARIELDRP
jgi:hypothetical protein